MIPAVIVFCYLAIVLYVGIFAFRKSKKGQSSAEDFFVANRSLGTFVFLLSLFGSNMTSFAILGSSGLAFRNGIGVFGLMASISGIVIPLSIFFVGTRIWALGKKFGHMTQVQLFRDRWEMGNIGTVIFILQALMLIPYIIIGVMGGGETLEGVSGGAVPYWLGGAVVALVVMSYVFFGGMRGTAWVNTLQTLMFLVFGTIAFIIIARGLGGFDQTVQTMADSLEKVRMASTAPATAPAASTAVAGTSTAAATVAAPRTQAPPAGAVLIRGKVNPADTASLDRMPKGYYLSYAFIPLSSIMFPHIAIFCLTAKRLSSFRKTVILYPLCILAVWLPAVFLGSIASSQPAVVSVVAAGNEEIKAFLSNAHKSGSQSLENAPQLFQLLGKSKDPAANKILQDVIAPVGSPMEPAVLGGRLVSVKDPAIRAEVRKLANSNSDGVMLDMLRLFAPALLAGVLGAAIMACVMASDSQILALSTMWAEDVYRYYGGTSEARQVWSARTFVVIITIASYIIALAVHQYANIFELAIQYAFSGYASMAPIMLAALFWKRSTKWGALAATLWIVVCLVGITLIQIATVGPATAVAAPKIILSLGDMPLLLREYNRISFTEYRFLMVLPMFLGACVCMVVGSLLTSAPTRATIERYFPVRAGTPADEQS